MSANITDKEFLQISRLVYDKFGIYLPDQKKGMVVARLNKILVSLGMQTFNDYYNYVLNDTTGTASSDLVDAISTNHTFFNREKDHFDFFTNKAIPEITAKLKAENSRDLRIWSAGCSSGEEPYMLVMLMMECLGSEYNLWNAGIFATDISDKALSCARSGIYNTERVNNLPPQMKHKYLKKIGPDQYQIDQKVMKEVLFRRFNLMNAVFPFKSQFHIIFCRNVMIYFDQKTKDTLVSKFFDMIVPGGYFFIGHAETLGRKDGQFEYVIPALYRKPLH